MEKYISLNRKLVNILNDNINSEYSNYKIGNNWLIMSDNEEFQELNMCKEITRKN